MNEQDTNPILNNVVPYKAIFPVGLIYFVFFLLKEFGGLFLKGEQAREFFVQSNLPGDILRKIWYSFCYDINEE